MMKTSKCSLRFFKNFLFAGIVLKAPFGSVADLTQAEKVWRTHEENGAVSISVRAQKVEFKTFKGPDPVSAPVGDMAGTAARLVAATPAAQKTSKKKAPSACEKWIKTLESDMDGAPLGGLSAAEWRRGFEEWKPFKKEDLEDIDDCERLPCLVKLNNAETGRMAAVEKPQRQETYRTLIKERVENYKKTLERKEYEFPGDPVDPWPIFESFGLKVSTPMPKQVDLRIRKLDFSPGKIKPIRQVMDRRIAVSKDRKEATLWRRDVYTDHYFDSWGEWTNITCAPTGDIAWVTQALVIELDLVKNDSLLSKVARPRMRAAVRDNGKIYLDQWFSGIAKKAIRAN